MRHLFESAAIGKLQLRNRAVRSATWEGMADEKGAPTRELNRLMADLAGNEIGLVITGHSYVSPEGKAGPGQMGVHEDALLSGLGQMAEAVHQAGGAIVLQLAHGGVNALDSGAAIGPSAVTTPFGKSCRAMTHQDISGIVSAFGAAAVRAKQSGFDGVQIHAAHGYLLSEFLSPYYNKRQDEYGGSIENRARIVLEVFTAVRLAVGAEYPVLIKLNSDDFLEDGLSVEEMLVVAAMLQQSGVDAIELSGGTIYEPGRYGTVRQGKIAPEDEGYYQAAARRYQEQIDVPLILVGGLRSYEVVQKLLADGAADFISLSRPLIREPDLVKRWRGGDHSPASCISCNGCYVPILTGKGLYCPVVKS
jgi:2,4-dienoyl-CoA reductase-like NADH-dependent reductase (Old Yellow Enzyme family)